MSDEQIEYNRITPSLMFEMQDDYMSDLSKNLPEIAIKYHVSYQMLKKVATANGWKARRDDFIRRFSLEMAEKFEKSVEGMTREAYEKQVLRELMQKYQHEEMFRAMDRSIAAHLEGAVGPETGLFVPAAVDTIAKLGPLVIKRAEHELRKQGHAEFTNNRGVKPSEDSRDPVIDDNEVSGALAKLEPESEATSD